MNGSSIAAIGLITMGALGGSAIAAGPSKADMDFCNQKAAQMATPSPVQPGTRTQPAAPPSAGMQGETSKPGTPVSPGAPSPSNTASGGRITDSSPPGVPPSQLGMAPIGETDSSYRQAYLACINERHN
jgi:hypothetical protein